MKRFLFFLLFFMLMFDIAKAEEQGAWNEILFKTEIPTGPADVEICHEILQIGDDKLCITDDGQVILVITATISLIAIPMKRYGGKKNEKID